MRFSIILSFEIALISAVTAGQRAFYGERYFSTDTRCNNRSSDFCCYFWFVMPAGLTEDEQAKIKRLNFQSTHVNVEGPVAGTDAGGEYYDQMSYDCEYVNSTTEIERDVAGWMPTGPHIMFCNDGFKAVLHPQEKLVPDDTTGEMVRDMKGSCQRLAEDAKPAPKDVSIPPIDGANQFRTGNIACTDYRQFGGGSSGSVSVY